MNLTIRQLSAIMLVPAILVMADVLSTRTLKFLILPPLGALTYLVFLNPPGVGLNFRRIVLAPSATGALAWIIAETLGYTPLSIALATSGTMLIIWACRAHMIVPPIALALLTLLLHQQVHNRFGYVVSVALFTLAIYVVYLVWSRLPLDQIVYRSAPVNRAGTHGEGGP